MVVLFIPKGREKLVRWVAFASTLVPLGLAVVLYLNFNRNMGVSSGGYGLLHLPGPGGGVLGFEFAVASRAADLPERLPAAVRRHAAAALAIVTGQLAA